MAASSRDAERGDKGRKAFAIRRIERLRNIASCELPCRQDVLDLK